jgi:hypothetical protein
LTVILPVGVTPEASTAIDSVAFFLAPLPVTLTDAAFLGTFTSVVSAASNVSPPLTVSSGPSWSEYWRSPSWYRSW